MSDVIYLCEVDYPMFRKHGGLCRAIFETLLPNTNNSQQTIAGKCYINWAVAVSRSIILAYCGSNASPETGQITNRPGFKTVQQQNENFTSPSSEAQLVVEKMELGFDRACANDGGFRYSEFP